MCVRKTHSKQTEGNSTTDQILQGKSSGLGGVVISNNEEEMEETTRILQEFNIDLCGATTLLVQ